LDGATAAALEATGEAIAVADGILYDPAAYQRIVDGVMAAIDRDGNITLATYRDMFATSRKYAQATLEHLDQVRITRRVGDERVRGIAAPPRKEPS
jgi:selenocysteine-specific elongation factor